MTSHDNLNDHVRLVGFVYVIIITWKEKSVVASRAARQRPAKHASWALSHTSRLSTKP
jgi:hypothetical protein